MADKETTVSWMMRGINEHSSLLFAVPIIVEEDEPELFGAAVIGMHDRMGASGRTAHEAFENAKLLFMATVDDALARGSSSEFATGVSAITVKVPISKAQGFFDLLESELAKHEDRQVGGWLSLPSVASATEHHTE
jgi:hypothetical protein